MSEFPDTPVLTPPSPGSQSLQSTAPPGDPPAAAAVSPAKDRPEKPIAKKKRPNVRRTRNIILLLLFAVILSVGGFFLWKFVSAKTPVNSELQSQPVAIGTIQSTAAGQGTASPEDSIPIVPTSSGKVVDVFVSLGDEVTEGQPLYSISNPDGQDQVDSAQEQVKAAQDAVTAQQDTIQEHQDSIGDVEDEITSINNNIEDIRQEIVGVQDDIAGIQGEIAGIQDEITAIHTREEDLTVRAPFDGKLFLEEDKKWAIDDNVSNGDTIVSIVDDSKLKLSLYFSTAYQDEVTVGREVTVSVPAVMGSYPGTVAEIHNISYISPEGAEHFEAVIVFDNPGTLTEKMVASAVLTAADGSEIYPYQNGTTEFALRQPVRAKEAGPVVSIGNLRDYAKVTEGEALLTLGTEKLDEEIAEKEKEIEEKEAEIVSRNKDIEAKNKEIENRYQDIENQKKQIQNIQEQIADDQKRLGELNQEVAKCNEELSKAREAMNPTVTTAPIAGTIATCSIVAGGDAKAGETAVLIQNSAIMSVEILVDDRNIGFIQQGMEIELTDNTDNQNMYIGTVSSVDMVNAKTENGMTQYPVTVVVDNTDGTLMTGIPLNYSFVTNQSDECMMVPMQSVNYMSNEDGETYAVVFIQADERPENAVDIELPEVMEGEAPQYPTPEDGFYPVPVETGLNDSFNVEITSGLNGGEIVFVQFLVESYYG